MNSKLQPTVLITGVSSGIGLETAKIFVKNNYQVFGTVRDKTLQPIPGVQFVEADVRDEKKVKAAVAEVQEKTGRIDILVNNAGATIVGPMEETSIEQAQELFNINFFGYLRFVNAVLPIMRAQRSGRMIHNSSVVGFLPSPFMGIYGATKHAVEGMSESLDHEIRSFGIRSILVEPGFTNTSIDKNGTITGSSIPDYSSLKNSMGQAVSKGVASGDSADVIAKVIYTAATESDPKLRYPAGKGSQTLSLLRSLVPAKSFDKTFRKRFGLPLVRS